MVVSWMGEERGAGIGKRRTEKEGEPEEGGSGAKLGDVFGCLRGEGCCRHF